MRALARWTPLLVVAAVLVSPSTKARPTLQPYWSGDFRHADYCQFATIFQSSSVNPGTLPTGYVTACPGYGPFARDPAQRVHLTRRPAPPAATSRWSSYQELRTTDGPWYEGSDLAKATIRLTAEQTLDGPFEMGAVRWFRFSFYLPLRFNWPESGWYELFDLHNAARDPSGADWPTIGLVVSPSSGRRRYIALNLEGASAGANRELVKLLQLTKRTGSRIVRAEGPGTPAAFNRWHTLILGVRFSDDGTTGHSTGWINAYFDGRLVYARARPTVWKNESSVWLQLQNYMQYGRPLVDGATSSVVYFADARIGRTYASVAR
jgi:hypothetical protein